jgi:hypothetical protein
LELDAALKRFDAFDGLKPGQPIVLQAERNSSLRFLVLEND